MYSDGRLFRSHPLYLSRLGRLLAHLGRSQDGYALELAGGQALPRLHPLHESGLSIADGAADTDVGRAVAAHARLREPREAHLQMHGRFLSG